MITELKEAVRSKLLNVCARVYYLEAPASVTFPYIVFQEVTNVETRDTASRFPSIPVDISVYTKSIAEGDSLIESIRTLFDDSESSFDLMSYYVISVTFALQPKPIPYADNIKQFVIEYDFELQKK